MGDMSDLDIPCYGMCRCGKRGTSRGIRSESVCQITNRKTP